jgi:HSP20 family protein
MWEGRLGMSMMRWDPARELAAAQSEMRRVMEAFGIGGGDAGGEKRGWLPPMDVHDDGEQFVVEMELPGVRAEDVQIECENGAVTISGERRQEARSGQATQQLRVERRFGSFTRTLPLPQGINEDAIEAEMRDGVLELRIPRPEQPKPRRIEVRSEGQRQTIDAGTGDNGGLASEP